MDTTNYAQSLMHMIKGNLGAGILALPATFNHLGLINALLGLPMLCLVCTYCVHMLVSSSRAFQTRTAGSVQLHYSTLARHSFSNGPLWMRRSSGIMCCIVDGTLLVAQLGVCCVYLVFIVDNIISILATYGFHSAKIYVFAAVYPVALLLSFIRTLNRLSIASACANLCQVVGIVFVLEYLIRDMGQIDMNDRRHLSPFKDVALGFGSAMFAFEGISVVLPIFSRMKNQDRMSGLVGVVNVAFAVLLALYMLVGLAGFLKFGGQVRDSITLNLPATPLYDVVRAIFTSSILLTYPLQFYVPNEIIWTWVKKNLLSSDRAEMVSVIRAHSDYQKHNHHYPHIAPPRTKLSEQNLRIGSHQLDASSQQLEASKLSQADKQFQLAQFEAQTNDSLNGRQSASTSSDSVSQSSTGEQQDSRLLAYEYLNRTLLVTFTFALAITVPYLNLMMDLIGAVTGTSLCLIFPSLIYIGNFWTQSSGSKRYAVLTINILVIAIGVMLSVSGATFSLKSILEVLQKEALI